MSVTASSVDNGNVLAKPFEEVQSELQKKCDYIIKRINRLKEMNEAASLGVQLSELKEEARKRLPEVESQLEYLKRLNKMVEESRIKHKRATKDADRVARLTNQKSKGLYLDGVSMGHLIAVAARPDIKKAYMTFMKNGARDEDKISAEEFRVLQEVHFLLSPTTDAGESYNEFIGRVQVSNAALNAILEESTDFVVEGASGADIQKLTFRFRDSQFWAHENEVKKPRTGRKATVFEFAASSLKTNIANVSNAFFNSREEHEIVYVPVTESTKTAPEAIVELKPEVPAKEDVETVETEKKEDDDEKKSIGDRCELASVSLKSSSPSAESISPLGDELPTEIRAESVEEKSDTENQRKASLVTSSSVENETPFETLTTAETEKSSDVNSDSSSKPVDGRPKRTNAQRPRRFNGNKRTNGPTNGGDRSLNPNQNAQNGYNKNRVDENGSAPPRKQFENTTNRAQRFNKGDSSENFERSQKGYDKPHPARVYNQQHRVRAPPPGVCGFTFTSAN